MYGRLVERKVKEALLRNPVVMIAGPRRTGKTTLALKTLAAGRKYITLDDQLALAAAQADPVGFVVEHDQAVIDEVQRVPDLLLAIKNTVVADSRPGRFVLTGSAKVLTLPGVADSMAGRMEILRLLPLACAEVRRTTPTFLDRLFEGELRGHETAIVGDDLVKLVLLGGFPEAIRCESERAHRGWARSYLTSVLARDMREISEVRRLSELPKFVRCLANNSAQLINYSRLGHSVNVSSQTGQRYVALLEQLFLISTVQPWYATGLGRIARTPKLHFIDSGLLAAAYGLNFGGVKTDRGAFGTFLRSFVYSEVLKLTAASDLRLTLYHFRDQLMHDVDIVLQRDDGTIAGVKVKSVSTVQPSDFAGLLTLAEEYKERFAHGVVLYDGANLVPFSDRLVAAPLSALWN